MALVTISGISEIKKQSKALASHRESFNNSLIGLVNDWSRTVKTIYATQRTEQAIKGLFKVSLLKQEKQNGYRASLSIKIAPTLLSSFSYIQIRRTIGNNLLKVQTKKKDKLQGKYVKGSAIYTNVKLVKSSSFTTARVGSKQTSPKDIGNKGFLYTRRSRISARASTPTGIYIRTEAATWKNGKRTPILLLHTASLGHLVNSNRVRGMLNFKERLNKLGQTLVR